MSCCCLYVCMYVWRAPLPNPAAATVLWAMDYYLGVDFFDNCVNVNGAPRMRTPSRWLGTGWAAAGARARSAHAIGAERVARGGDGSHSGCAVRHTGAQRPRRAAPCAERRARSAGRDQARRRRQAHCAHTTGAERVARGGASWRMLWRRQQLWEAFASASATLSLTSLVGGLKTMSPAPGRRPPIYTTLVRP